MTKPKHPLFGCSTSIKKTKTKKPVTKVESKTTVVNKTFNYKQKEASFNPSQT